MNRKSLAVIPLVLALLLAGLVPMMSDESDAAGQDNYLAQSDDISVAPSRTDFSMEAGETINVQLFIKNKIDKPILVSVYFNKTNDDVNVSFPLSNGEQMNYVQFDGVGAKVCQMNISVWEYARTTDNTLTFSIMITDPDRGYPIKSDASDIVKISVHSSLSAGASYNKIMGVLDNNLPAPFDSPVFTTLISFAIWIMIAVAAAYMLVPAVTNAVGKVVKKRRGDQ